jgi:UPF0716 protein FxsA
MQATVLLSFAAATLVELLGLQWVSGQISILNTISLIMLTFLVGVVVGRSWGKEYFEKMQWSLKSRTPPEGGVVNGAVMAIASLLLMTPGIVTDSIGLLILIPFTRGPFLKFAASLARGKVSRGEMYYFFKS